MADGCDGFEFDLRLTADGQAVVCHDPVWRDPKVGKIQIAQATAEQLSGLPRLCDVLVRYGNAFLDIELKVAGLESVVVEAVRDHPPERFVVSSFLPEVLEAVYAADANIPLGLICETRVQLRRWKSLPVGYVIPNCLLVDQKLAREWKDAGKKVLVWTVNAAAEMRRLAGWGVDGMISDNPKRLAGTLASRAGKDFGSTRPSP